MLICTKKLMKNMASMTGFNSLFFTVAYFLATLYDYHHPFITQKQPHTVQKYTPTINQFLVLDHV